MAATQNELRTLKTIAEVLNQTTDITQALDRSLALILRELQLASGWIFLWDRKQDAYVLQAHHGLPPAMLEAAAVWLGSCRCNHLARDQALDEAQNILRCSRLEQARGDTRGLSHHASIALKTPRGPLGIFNVASKNGQPLQERQLAMVRNVGHQFAIAIERTRAFAELRQQRQREQEALVALTDVLFDASNLPSVIRKVVEAAAHIFQAAGALLLPNRDVEQNPFGWNRFTCFRQALDPERARTYLREDPCQSALFELGRPCQITLTPTGQLQDMRTFPLDDSPYVPINAADNHVIWQFWASLGLRSILMAPIPGTLNGPPVGMLYVVHREPRPAYKDAHLSTLIANHAALAIEQARYWALQSQQQAMARELAVARDIQTSTLLPSKPSYAGWSCAVRYQAARAIGGDFYDFIHLANGGLGLAVADIAGKGVPAALMMTLSRTLLRAIAPQSKTPVATLAKINTVLLQEGRKDRFVSMFYGTLDTVTGQMRYGRDGHNPPLYYSKQHGAVSSLLGPGIVLGVADDPKLVERTVTLQSGDVLVLFTDGITEATNNLQADFGEERLAHWLEAHHHEDAETMATALQRELQIFTQNTEQDDDMTLVIVKRA